MGGCTHDAIKVLSWHIFALPRNAFFTCVELSFEDTDYEYNYCMLKTPLKIPVQATA